MIDSNAEISEIEAPEVPMGEELYSLGVPAADIGHLILVSKGFKPATFFDLEHDGEESYEEFREKAEIISEDLLELELPHVLVSWNLVEDPEDPKKIEYISFMVGKDEESLDRLIAADEMPDGPEKDIAFGRAVGYPETAVQAYADRGEDYKFSLNGESDTLLSKGEIPSEIREDPAYPLLGFRLSKAHYKEEFEHVKIAADIIKAASPFIHQKIVVQASQPPQQ